LDDASAFRAMQRAIYFADPRVHSADVGLAPAAAFLVAGLEPVPARARGETGVPEFRGVAC